MKFKVGDKVRVKSWEELWDKYGVRGTNNILIPNGMNFPWCMKKFCNGEYIVSEVDRWGSYQLEDCGTYGFCDEMLCGENNDNTQGGPMSSPVITFESQQQAEECLAYWQEKLFLNNWIIKVKLVEPEEIEGCQGSNSFVHSLMSSLISISKYHEEGLVAKECHEQTLVHELLHLKYNLMDSDSKSYESTFLSMEEHRLLEQLAKSLIMVKYNLSFNWFKNF